ncbi:hypothetical protein [Streptomyces sp. NPDC020983]|uniref:hypothetical protein n=1 Tax=Streptomyces sp. NPDC020983 TaxID=3365106 RepID=UPI00378747D3
MTREVRRCELCGCATDDWTISVEPDPDPDSDDGEITVTWCRDPEDCMLAHEAAETAALGRP